MKTIKTKIFLLMNFLTIASFTFAADKNEWERIHNPGFGGNFNGTLHAILAGIIQVSIPLLVLALVYVGFLFVKAQGSPEELKKVRSAFLWVLVGALIILGADLILTMIESTIDESGLLEIQGNSRGIK